MAEFSFRLAERIESSPLFQEALADLQQQSLVPLLGGLPSLESVRAARLSEAAIALARSTEPRHQGLAQDIAYSLAACHADSRLRGVWRHILAETGNFPAGDYVSDRPLIEQELPWTLKVREAARRDQNTVTVLNQEIVFTDFQADVWWQLHGHQFVNVSAPTSAGKSFLVQMYLLDELANTEVARNIVYLVPSRSLIFEVQASLTHALKPLADRVVVSSVPQVHDDLHAGKSLVFVLTQERLQTILNESTIEFDVVIVDEAQQIGDADRGILLLGCLEDALARRPETKMLFITPSSKDARTIAPLLGAKAVQTVRSAVRPVRQNLLFVTCSGRKPKRMISVQLHRQGQEKLSVGSVLTTRSIAKDDRLVTAALELGKEGQSIVYAWAPSSADGTASDLADGLPEPDNFADSPLEELSSFVAEHIHPEFKLAQVLRKGVGVHYGRLPTTISKAVEEYFDAGHIKYLVCTSTLLQGVNLPARNIFLKNPRKGPLGPLEANEFWNLAGRAGRLKRDTHGNVFLVDYEDWESQPVSDQQTTDVEPSICDALGVKQDLVLTYAQDAYHKSGVKKEALAESVFTRLFLDARDGTIDQTIERALARYPSVSTTALKDAVMAAQDRVSLPTSLLKRNNLISPLRQQELYDHLTSRASEGFLSGMILVHPRSKYPDPKTRLEAAFRAIHAHLEGRLTNEEAYYGWFALAWMRGESLRSLIDNRVDWERRQGNLDELEPKKIGSLARKVMEQVETKLRYHYVKYLRCYMDILTHKLIEVGRGDESEMPPIPLFLEFGASDRTLVSAMELGMSRIAALEVSKFLPKDKDAAFVRQELKAKWFWRAELSSFVVRELERLGLLD
ncbi:DEAD/DEAH box helicase [Cupriavidus sp. WGlv3]|uniref:DEAD/DEAH box helicase n=1 Tax=Cupriavidus sp. WGlv3 TaxID=2919924 RepID=UPI002090B96D|nr:DEAD/DEAH box helicase [Cupriavidus sp. WGlv3]MCO4861251.1 DEAD/DEAH box helicase [Cupriavidus sp. WGlv3]